MQRFDKPAITAEDQLRLLIDRGLTVQDPERALSFLQAVSFFRLTPYMRPFQVPSADHQFRDGARFLSLSRLYDFDRRLRLLVMDAIERIEVGVRAHICNYMGPKYGAHWYLKRELFSRSYDYDRLIQNIENKQERAAKDYRKECSRVDKIKGLDATAKSQIKQSRMQESYARHYQMTYEEPPLMPGWAMIEELTFGELSHLYKGLQRDLDKKTIAKQLGVNMPLLISWLHALTAIRNVCAHHSRLWNRELGIKPAHPKDSNLSWPVYLRNDKLHTRVGVLLAIMQFFMKRLAPHASWSKRLVELFAYFPEVDLRPMGLQLGWEKDPFWS